MLRRLLLSAAILLGTGLAAAGVLPAGPALADTLAEVKAGNAAFGEGRHEAAVEAYTRAILAGDLDPEVLAVTFNNRGVAYSELGDYDRAIQDYNQALTLRPGDATAVKNLRIGHSRRAGAYANLGEQEQALADYAKAIELDPRHAPTYVRRGQLLLERGDARAAAADLAKARELEPANREAQQLLARAEAGTAAPSAATDTAAAAAAAPPPAAGQAEAPTGAIAQAPAAEAPAPAATPAAGPAAAGATAGAGEQAPPAAERPPLPPVTVAEGEPRPFRTLQSVNLRSGPSNDYPRIGTILAGTVVSVSGESRGWMFVRLKNGKSGFVYQRWLEPAPAP